jgi:hypothetical protein
MKVRRILAVAAACALGGACSSSPAEPHGSPVLTQIYWIAGGVQSLAWSLDKDPTITSPLPPNGSEIDFVFDRRLDGAKIEDLVTMNGVTVAVPKEPAAVHVTWPNMGTVMSDPPFHITVDYNSVPRYGGVSSYIYARPDEPGFPSSTTVTLDLVPTLLTSAYNDPAVLPDPPATVKTSAFAAILVSTTSAVPPSYQLPLTFNNRLPQVPVTSPHVQVTAHGAAVPYKLLADANVGSRWYLAAADCLGGWPAGTTFEVTLDADFPDAFGGTLGQPSVFTFTTLAGAAATSTCPPPDGGAADGSPPGVDAAADAPVGGGADTGAVDGGADAAPEGPANAPDDGATDAG